MATKLAKDMVTKFGMSNELGPLSYGDNEDEVFLGRQITRQQHMSEETAKKVDIEVKRLVDEGYEKAKKILTTKIGADVPFFINGGTQIGKGIGNILTKESIAFDLKGIMPRELNPIRIYRLLLNKIYIYIKVWGLHIFV